MTYSNQVDRIVSPAATKYAPGRAGSRPTHIVLHHQAGFSSNTLYLMSTIGTRKVSANVVVNKDGTSVGVVHEESTPFTNGNLAWNRRSLTMEIENSAVGDASGWPISDAAHEEVAKIVADWCTRYGIPCDSEHVFGHRDLYLRYKVGYATSCPGVLRIGWILDRARELMGSGWTPAPLPAGPVLVTHEASNPNGRIVVDGILGPQTIRKLQYALGYRGATWLDGKFGPLTKKRLQAKLGVRVDGDFGPVSTRALQRHIGAYIDGLWGPQTTTQLQKALNAGTF